MSLEIEAKFQVATHDAVRKALQTLGAVSVGCVLETNHLFDDDSGRLRKLGHGLRVRSLEVLEGSAGGSTLTFKGTRQPGDLKIRPEIEIGVDHADRAVGLLQALGYRLTIVFEKRRESWKWSDCLIELDDLPVLGSYVEIEGPSVEAVERARNALGLEGQPAIPRSYAAMLHTICESAGLDPLNIRFQPSPR